ncbi:MAG: hypothetical protein AAFQ94_05520 [Bacteroidota bacterium]
MKPLNKIDKCRSDVRKLRKELRQLYTARFRLGYIKLAKPIRHGWFKHLTLRDDIARRKDASVFREILEVSGIDTWGLDKKHADKVWDRQNRKDNTIQFPGIMKLNQKRYNKLSKKAQKWYEGFDWYWTPAEGNVKRYYCRVPRYFFKITYTKAFITRKQIVDPKIDKRIAEIEGLLLSNRYYNYDQYNRRYRTKYMNDMYNRILRKRVKTALSNYNEETFDRQIYGSILW